MGFNIRCGISVGLGASIEFDDGVNTESITLDIGWYRQSELQTAINAALAGTTHFAGVVCTLASTAVFTAGSAFTVEIQQEDLGDYLGFGTTVTPSLTTHTATGGDMAISLAYESEPWTFRRRYPDRAAMDLVGRSGRPAYDHVDEFSVSLWMVTQQEIEHASRVLLRASRGTFEWSQTAGTGDFDWPDADIGGWLYGQLKEPGADLRDMEQNPRQDIRRVQLDIIGWSRT